MQLGSLTLKTRSFFCVRTSFILLLILDYRFTAAMSQIKRYCSKCDTYNQIVGRKSTLCCPECKTPFYFECSKCNRRDKAYNTIYNHVRFLCFPRELLSCDGCDYTTTIKTTLWQHIRSRHMVIDPKDYYKCRTCSRPFKMKKDLRGHEVHCGNDKKFQCKTCPYATKYKSSFQQHMHHHLLNEKIDDSARAAESSGISEFVIIFSCRMLLAKAVHTNYT